MTRRISYSIAVLFAAVLLLQGSFANGQVTTKYVVDFSDSRNHYIGVDLETEATGDVTELMIPVWTPGSYLVREFARNIDSLEVTTRSGKPLSFKKVRKNRWQVDTEGVDRIRISYRVYSNEMSVRTNWAGREFAVLNGAATFLTVPEYRDMPHTVDMKFPRGWQKSATSLKKNENRANSYLAENFDEIVDSPIVAGNLHFYPFEVSGVPHVLVNVGEKGHWNGAQAALDLKKMVKAHHDMWQTVPYDRYLFLNVICESSGGLEHDNSCLMMTSRWTFRERGRYQSWLSLASHEFFHTWNVRRLRPKGLVRYDYDNENYTPSLWVAEGVTSYYEDLLLARCKLMSTSEFLARLSSNIQSVQSRSGRKLQSLSDSSFDSWIKFYRPDENSANTSISYYSKGAVAAFLLDGRIRLVTDNEKSLDDVMRRLFELYSGDRGYTPKQFREVVNEITGEDFSDWFARSIDSSKELDYSDALEGFGLSLPGAATLEEDFDGNRNARPWAGMSVGGDNTVSRIELNSPATEAGINTGDEIIAVNGMRVKGNFSTILARSEIGDKLDLIIARRSEIQNVELAVGGRSFVSWRLRKATGLSRAQRNRYNSWFKPEPPKSVAAKKEPGSTRKAETKEDSPVTNEEDPVKPAPKSDPSAEKKAEPKKDPKPLKKDVAKKEDKPGSDKKPKGDGGKKKSDHGEDNGKQKNKKSKSNDGNIESGGGEKKSRRLIDLFN